MMSRANPVSRERSVYPPTVKIRPSIRRFYPRQRCFKTAKSREIWSFPENPIRLWAKSGAEEAPHGPDDPILARFVEIGMHRQADDIRRQALADAHAAIGNREILVRGLLMHRFRIIDRGRHAFRLQCRRK